MRDKFEKFRRKRYVSKGPVLGLTSYFTVPKGDGDVRVVFDGTKSGLNASIWSPSFGLPSSSSLLATLEPGTWMADIDVGEMFYNFLLDPKLRPYCGVDLKPYCQEASSWERWERCVMGVKSSPYGCIKMDLLGDEVNKGNHVTPTNPFHFDQVCLNLPGDPAYNPSSPWVSKIVSSNQRIAGDVKTYVDDKRPTGYSYAHCRAVARRTASILGYLGMQDASRKRELPSLRAGAWSGVVWSATPTRIWSQFYVLRTNGPRPSIMLPVYLRFSVTPTLSIMQNWKASGDSLYMYCAHIPHSPPF